MKRNQTNFKFLAVLAHEASFAKKQMHYLAKNNFFAKKEFSIGTLMD